MSLPPQLPLLLYAEPTWSPSPRKVVLYLAEKRLPTTVVKVVPHLDEEASKAFPKIVGKAASQFMGPTVPKLAIAKAKAKDDANTKTTGSGSSGISTNQDDYTWLVESSAILEYLEDLCDAHPELLPPSAPPTVRSLRHGDDLVRRGLVRAQLMRAEAVWILASSTLALGSQKYNDITQSDSVHIPSAQALVTLSNRVVLEKLDEQLGEVVDFAGLAQSTPGAATVADITLFITLHWFRNCHGMEIAKGHPNMELFMAAWSKRSTSTAGMPDGKYPDMVIGFRDGFKEEVWPSPVFE